MGKKLLSLVLVFMLLFTFILSSCSPDSTMEGDVSGSTGEEDADYSNRTPYTLTLWLPAKEGTTDDSVKQVEAALNEIFNASYTTSIRLRVFDEDEYETAVLEKLDSIKQKLEDDAAESSRRKELEQSRRQEGITLPETTASNTETDIETYVNEYSQTSKKYPTVDDYQFDIFLVTSYDSYVDLIKREDIMSLEDKLNGSSKVLKEYIYPTFLEAAKAYNGVTYAIPNNHGMGQYKFLLTNKELAKKYDYDPENLQGSIKNCEHFIRSVARYEEDDSVVPLLSWVDPAGMTYWSNDGSWAPLASIIGNDATYNTLGSITNIFRNSEYKANFKLMKEFEESGMIAEDPDKVEKFAVGVVSADCLADVEEVYGEKYDISIYEYPKATQEELFTGAFAVSAATKSLTRAMEIITAINTRPEVRNLLQYGVEGVHYERDEDGRVHRLDSTYNMNILYTGNTYIAYPEEDMDLDQWEKDKQRNLDTILTPFSYVPGLHNESNKANYDEITRLGDEIYDDLMSIKAEDVDDYFAEKSSELSKNEKFGQMTGTSWEHGVNAIYSIFYSEHYQTAEPDPDDTSSGDSTSSEGGETTAPSTDAGTDAPTTDAPAK